MAYEYGILTYSSLGNTSSHYEMGYKFTANENINVCGLRVMYPSAQETTAHLWDSSGNLIASANVTAIANEWVEVLLNKTIVLESGKTYCVSCYNTSSRYYAEKRNFTFNKKITFAAGVYNSTQNSFPRNEEVGYVYPLVDIIIGSLFEKLYLIRVGTELFTKVGGVVTSLGEVEVTSELFLTNGFEEIPTSDDLIGFENPEVLLWYNSEDNVPGLTATVKASPKNNQQIITNAIDLTHSSITGIESAIADCDGELIIAVSFDNKQTWKAWNGETWSLLSEEFSGMNKETLESITLEQWNLLYSGATSMYLKVSFLDATQVIRTITIDFAN